MHKKSLKGVDFLYIYLFFIIIYNKNHKIMKIGNTDYNVNAIKEMGFEEFDKLYKDRIADTKEVFEQVTGEKVEEKEEDLQKPLPKSLVSKK